MIELPNPLPTDVHTLRWIVALALCQVLVALIQLASQFVTQRRVTRIHESLRPPVPARAFCARCYHDESMHTNADHACNLHYCDCPAFEPISHKSTDS